MTADAVAIADVRPQHLEALELANRVRLARADLKRQVAAGKVDATEVILACPWMAETMSLGELLTSQKRWGRTRSSKFLKSVGVAETKLLSTLTERQRVTLGALLSAKRHCSEIQ
jgi:hypothetical protein